MSSAVRAEWRKVKAERSMAYQTQGTCEFFNQWGIDVTVPLSVECIKTIQEHLKPLNYQIIVIDSSDHSNRLFYEPTLGKHIVLEYMHENNKHHFNFVKEMNQYLDAAYYCEYCNKGHNNISHRCSQMCKMCRSSPPCEKIELVKCDACRRSFYNMQCFTNHRDNKLCTKIKNCDKCFIDYNENPKKPHKCEEHTCNWCKKVYTESHHYCMLKPLDINKLKKEDEITKIIVAYDIEATQKDNGEGLSLHVPNLLIAGSYCFLIIYFIYIIL